MVAPGGGDVVVSGPVGGSGGDSGDSKRSDDKVVQLKPVCPACKMEVSKPDVEDPTGKLSICIYCMAAMKFEKTGGLVLLSPEDWDALTDEAKAEFLKATKIPNHHVKLQVLMMKLKDGLKAIKEGQANDQGGK